MTCQQHLKYSLAIIRENNRYGKEITHVIEGKDKMTKYFTVMSLRINTFLLMAQPTKTYTDKLKKRLEITRRLIEINELEKELEQ